MRSDLTSKVVVETRVSVIHLAVAHKFISDRGLTVSNRSELIRTILDIFVGGLLSKQLVKDIDTVHEAHNYLLSKGIRFSQGSKGLNSIMKSLQEESLGFITEGFNMHNNEDSGIDQDEFDKAMDILNESLAVSKDRTKQGNE